LSQREVGLRFRPADFKRAGGAFGGCARDVLVGTFFLGTLTYWSRRAQDRYMYLNPRLHNGPVRSQNECEPGRNGFTSPTLSFIGSSYANEPTTATISCSRATMVTVTPVLVTLEGQAFG
jgi:hypothetical protein